MVRLVVRYEFHVDDPHTHRAQVRIEVPEVVDSTLDLVVPSWVPGSYSIVDPARNLRDFRAARLGTSDPLPVTKVDKARWRVGNAGGGAVEARYVAYGHDLSDSSLDITNEHYFLNAGMFLPYAEGHQNGPHEIAIHVPAGWKVYTELEEVGKAPPRFRARDYDELVDEPIDVGTPVELTIHPSGIPHRILFCGRGGNYEAHRLEEDLKKIVEATVRLFGGSPLRHYTFFYHLSSPGPDSWGGLEHKNSASIVVPRTAFRPADDYLKFLQLSAHEYFHLYNVKRIRPKVLGPFDYTRENYTKLLWAMEGSTDYFTGVLVRRAGAMTVEKYLEQLGKQIRWYLTTPGRKVASLEELSWNAWIDLYKPYEETPNQSVSYYLKGGLVTLCLDLEVRSRTENRSSVDAIFRTLWQQHGKTDRGLEEDGVLRLAQEVTGLDLGPFFGQYVSGTAEIDFGSFLGHAGLRLDEQEKPEGKEGEPVPGYLGVEFSDDSGRARITVVRDDAPARRAGLYPRDEVVALDGQKVSYRDFPDVLQRYPPGTEVEITVFRRGLLSSMKVTTGKPPPEKLRIRPREDATPLARQIYESWLEAKWEPPKQKDGTETAKPVA